MFHFVSSCTYFGLLPLVLFSVGALANADTSASPVWVVNDSRHPVRGEAHRVIELDAPARIEAELSKQLSKNSLEAKAQAQGRFQDGVVQGLLLAYQGTIEAWRLGVAKIPAVVVAGRYVVYGAPDVARAVVRVEQWRRTQP